MKRFRSLATFLVAIAVASLGLVAPTALPASAITCTNGFVPNETGTSCIAPIVPAPTQTTPAAGTGNTNYVPPAGGTTQTQTQTQTHIAGLRSRNGCCGITNNKKTPASRSRRRRLVRD